MDYDGLVTALSDLLPVPSDDAQFQSILPTIISDAEGRIYREMDFLATRVVDSTTPFIAGTRAYTLPSNIILVQKVAAISPANTQPSAGTRYPLEMVALDVLDYMWPIATGSSATGIPQYGAMQDENTLVVAPTPDAAYIAEITGIYRPDPISSTNTTTYISLNYPDLLVAACMIFGSAWQKNFGAMSDNPQQSISWESHYQTQMRSAYEEEQRRKGASTGWSPFQQTPLATPPRT